MKDPVGHLVYVYDTIVHPTDGSSCAERGLEHAISLADVYDADLHVVYVVRTAQLPPSLDPDLMTEQMAETGERIVRRNEERARDAGLREVTTHVAHGIAHTRILGLVEEEDADLIVMGTHGRSGLERYLLGSVTEKVIRESSVPVLAVEPLEESD